MPTRQLASLSIDQLEALFDAKRDSHDVLTSLLNELSHRRMKRAKALRARVMQALGVAEKNGD
jgi:hypothetical protein